METQPGLLGAIVDLATYGCGADERRQSEKLRTMKTLNDLTAELHKMGFTLSRSGVYLHLLPRRPNSTEGKRHIETVPVKLCRPQSDLHHGHPDQDFCTASIRALEDLSSLLGPNEVSFLSIDAKARVPLGITAASKQTPMVMHLEYKIKLPDHDFVKAPRHKLVPDVYAGIVIKDEIGNPQAVSYSGPAYVAIRSAKHSNATAVEHLRDLQNLKNIASFDPILKNDKGELKPIRIITCDGGPDENPRYAKTIKCAVEQFRKEELDALFIATNAPGRSAFNRVERRMAPLSKMLSGVVLPHDSYGNHLDSQGKTIDADLELQNFEKAGQVLAGLWNGNIIDGHTVTAEFINNELEMDFGDATPTWMKKHVRESQYFLQIVKCLDPACCKNFKSSFLKIMPERFLCGPLPLSRTSNGLEVKEGGRFSSLFVAKSLDRKQMAVPQNYVYDFACPSIQGLIKKRTCGSCGQYFASLKSLKYHGKCCQEGNRQELKVRPVRVAARRQRELMCQLVGNSELEWVDEEDLDTEGIHVPEYNLKDQSGTPVITMAEYMASPWDDGEN